MSEYTNFQLGSLISNSTRMEIKIAEYLHDNKRYVGTDELCQVFKITGFYARKIQHMLEEHVRELNRPDHVVKLLSKGIKLEVPTETDLNYLIIFLWNTSPKIKIIENIFLGRFNSVTQYSIDNHLSEATVRRRLSEVRKTLKQLNINVTQGKKIEFEGNEVQIRLFLLSFYWRLYGGLVWPFPFTNERKIEIIVEAIESDCVFKDLNSLDKKRIMYLFTIIEIRINNKKFVEEPKSFKTTKNVNHIKELFYNTGIVNKEKNGELYFIYNLFKGFCLFSNMEKELAYEIDNKMPAGIATQYSMDKISKTFLYIENIQVKEVETFLFSAHVFANLTKDFFTDMNGYYYNNLINKYSPCLKKKLVTYFKLAEKETSLSLFKEHQFLLSQYTLLVISLLNTVPIETEVIIYLETDFLDIVNNIFERKIRNHFQNKYNITVLSSLEEKNRDDIDILLTTIPVSEYTKQFPKSKIVAIKNVLHFSDYARIEKAIISVLLKHKDKY
ncbi:helix-turn-helix domain-containing protein [Enterococcus faecalis]|uniref:helix-turn-helix domain-containing protein n=1 Tax=Enterococcus faecalis TaxID=1351 RepID=UPI0013D4A290|nr:helix-turn-helix domain-containing protein [Enterococcus faecalis]NGG35310.1 hypothetical protein [Enterococcus faecalis]